LYYPDKIITNENHCKASPLPATKSFTQANAQVFDWITFRA